MNTRGTYLMFERLKIIEDAIRDGNYPNTPDLQRKIEYSLGTKFSTATLARDLEFLKVRKNCPIEYDKTQKGYFWNGK